MEWITDPNAWIALFTLTALEIVLGIDNIIFISILVGRLPAVKRNSARRVGLFLAMGTRILLLLSLSWVMSLVNPLFKVASLEISGRDMILLTGGLFLLWKSTHEIHKSLEDGTEEHKSLGSTFAAVIFQIAVIDIIFSLDSVITAIGMAEHVGTMITAVILSVIIMMFAAESIGNFVDKHPTIKMLALSFLILVAVALIGEGMDLHIPKGYIYFAMAFSTIVEMLNIKIRARKTAPVKLHKDLES
jgi:predicted tellurium resistance membrane protein TerC